MPSGSASTTQVASAPWPTKTRTRAERLETLHLPLLVDGTQVEVETVLNGLVLGDLQEQQVGNHSVLRGAGRWLEHDLVGFLVSATPPQRRLPEARERRGIASVDAQTLDAKVHPPPLPALIVPTPAPVEPDRAADGPAMLGTSRHDIIDDLAEPPVRHVVDESPY